MHVVATAGHVDHGKSTLVQALTGTDPDRWAEEKARGLTIDLGFAGATLPSGRGVSFVDVPGHVRFLKNMLAGVGGVDACLFVVAATEGWKPQSEEHLRILELLGIGHGLVALTKVGLVDDEWRDLAHLELADHLEGTFLADAQVVDVDIPAGRGADDLRAALDRLLATAPTASDRGRPRLWIDRSFAAKGAGTVVTGTLAGGALAVGDELVVAGTEPATERSPSAAPIGGTTVRVRGLESLGQSQDRIGPGHRVAVNLAGVSHDAVVRGHALVHREQWSAVTAYDATLEVLAGLDHRVSRRGAYLAYLGSGEHPVRLRVLGPASLGPGERGLVRLHLPVGLPLLPGDRYLLRESGRSETVGGGQILDVNPVTKASRARPDRSVDRVMAERGWVDVDDLDRLTGERRQSDLGSWVVAPAERRAAEARLRELVEGAGDQGVDVATVSARDRLVLAALPDVEQDGGRVRAAGRSADVDDRLSSHPYLAALQAEPFTPPPPGGVDRSDLRALLDRGAVVERDGVWFAASAVNQAVRRVAGLLAANPDGITVSQVREALGTTRKWAVPLLAHLDATGVTRRRGDVRIAGPRLPDAG